MIGIRRFLRRLVRWSGWHDTLIVVGVLAAGCALVFALTWAILAVFGPITDRPPALEHHVTLEDGSRKSCLDFGEWGQCFDVSA